MPAKQFTARKPSFQRLTISEIERLTDRLVIALENDDAHCSLLVLMLDQIDRVVRDPMEIDLITSAVKRRVFAATSAADNAQEQFTQSAYTNKGRLLMFPSEA